MLAGFVVPHAHYRVFHGDPAADSQHAAPNDQFPLALSPLRVEAAPTDLHLREFAQLELQANAVGDAVSGSLAECFLFYPRLFTVESFAWPDFLAAVFTKMAEHFASSENDIVRSAILKAFQRAKAHVAQVNDPSKLLAHLSGPMMHATSVTARTLTLQLLATMPSLIAQDSVVQQHIVKKISAEDRDERSAAIEAARAFLPLSPSFRKDVLVLALESKSATSCCLVADAVSTSAEAQRAWTHCAELYERLTDDKSAVASQLITSGGEDGQIRTVLEGVFSRVRGSHTGPGRTQMRLKLSALLLLEKWSSVVQDLGEKAEAFLKRSQTWLSTTTDVRFGKTYTLIIANIARQKLALAGTKSPEHGLDELFQLLHPRAAVAAKNTWNYALDAIAQLSQEFPELLATHVASSDDGQVANPTTVDFERQLLSSDHYETHADRYEMAKLAILRGRFTLATQLMEVIAAKADSECFVALRLEWVQLLQSAQQLAGEAAFTNSPGFLTYAENTAFTAKPRSRSQLGVSLGTDFTSVLKGALALSRSAQRYWRERAEAIEAEVLHRSIVNLPVAWGQVIEAEAVEEDGQVMVYLPFETPVHVKATSLTLKGSFVLVAKLALVDCQGERWPLAATGCRRGFIVY
uniref:Integrator complex subunit 7 N-terminal domain-containing protein n=1 Tax=Phytophthora ramorum TaxID=164328 RepID=H3HD39_PHYRM